MKESTVLEPIDAQKNQKIKVKWGKSILEAKFISIGSEKEMVKEERKSLKQQKVTESLKAPVRKPLKEKNTQSKSKPRKRERET